MPHRVTIKVPATTANLGPGFDCIGMALDLWNTFSFEVGRSGFRIEGEGDETLEQGEKNLVYQAASSLYAAAKVPVPKISISCTLNIPLKRGLGSSATAIVGGLLGANILCGEPLSSQELLEKAAKLEGHPDNVAPALLGGCQIVAMDGERLVTASVPIPEELWAVIYIPDLPMSTTQAREVLPKAVDRNTYIFNLSRVALLVNALATGHLEHLNIATQDTFHQPPRESLFPGMRPIFRAALAAGALGVFLSGAGSSILALTSGKEMSIGYEMADAAEKHGVTGRLLVTRPTSLGAHVSK